MLQALKTTPPQRWALYLVIYCSVGFVNHRIGQAARLAEFAHDWQVLTCYGLYLVPWSLAVRARAWHEQYLWGLLALGLIELPGYALGTSIAHPDNLFDRAIGVRNFSLAMTMMFAGLLPAGNALLGAVERLAFKDASWRRAASAPGSAAPGAP